jgi:hypothetical protein
MSWTLSGSDNSSIQHHTPEQNPWPVSVFKRNGVHWCKIKQGNNTQ